MIETLSSVFTVIVMQSCKAGLVICAILPFCSLLGKRLSPATRFAVWLLVPLTLLRCVSVPSPFSVWNIFDSAEISAERKVQSAEWDTVNNVGFNEPVTERSAVTGYDPERFELSDNVVTHETAAGNMTQETEAGNAVSVANGVTGNGGSELEPTGHSVRPLRDLTAFPAAVFRTADSKIDVKTKDAVAILWLIGCITMTLIFLRQGMICRRWIRRAKLTTDARVLAIFEQCVRTMRVQTWLVVTESAVVSGPFLIGVLRPTLLLPESLARNATDEQLRTVFLHELAHLKRWDIWTSWLMTCLLIVHWFNPLLWLAVRRLNDAREEACDALAVTGLNPIQRKNYGLSLVDIATQFQSPIRTRGPQTPGLVGISESGKILTRRIEMIRDMGTWKIRWTLIAAMFALLLGAVTLTDAQMPSKPGNIVVNGVEYTPVVKEDETVQKEEETESAEEPSVEEPRKLLISGRYKGTIENYDVDMVLTYRNPRAANTYGFTLQMNVNVPHVDVVQFIVNEGTAVHKGNTLEIELTRGEIIKELQETETRIIGGQPRTVRKRVTDRIVFAKKQKNLTATIVYDDTGSLVIEIPEFAYEDVGWETLRLEQLKPVAIPEEVVALFGEYEGQMGDEKIDIRMSAYGGYPFYHSEEARRIRFYVFTNGLPRKDDGISRDSYSGSATLMEDDTLRMNINMMTSGVIGVFSSQNRQRVPTVLENLTAKVTRNGDDITLEIPENDEWDAVRVTKVKKDVPPKEPSVDVKPNATSEYVWDKFGLRVAAVNQEELQRRMAGVNSPYAFEGALEVLEVKPGSIFGPLKIQKGDLLAAIITPKDPWNTTRVADLKYLADRWTPEEMGNSEVQVIVIRNKKLYEGRVPVGKK